MKTISISHISHGITKTGGFIHEQFLLEKLSEAFTKNGFDVKKKTIRTYHFFYGFGHIKLMWWSFKHATSDINIVVARSALSSIIRNIFSNRKTLIVLHYFDERDNKRLTLKWYYDLLFLVLSNFRLKNISIIAVAPFWVNYFEKKTDGNIPVFLFPNFFETKKYQPLISQQKIKQIHLGQYSWKNDPRIFELAKQLSDQGFRCYFSTLIKKEEGEFEGYDIVFEDTETYLKNMARSLYTLAFIGINEGWNRVAHESILVGTTLIGNNAGGLGDMLNESGSLIANEPQQFIDHILNNHRSHINQSFIDKYDEQNSGEFLKPIVEFLSK